MIGGDHHAPVLFANLRVPAGEATEVVIRRASTNLVGSHADSIFGPHTPLW
jgi:hypothetical protein